MSSQIDQVPESRRRLLEELKALGRATTAALAERVGMTSEATRQQLLVLQRDGLVAARIEREPGRAGRPATHYALTPRGEELFPRSYDALAVVVLDGVSDALGPEALERVLAAIADRRVAAWEPRLRGLPLEARLEALKALYAEGDAYMEVERAEDGEGFRLIERNCPFLATALERPALCSVTVHALRRLLGVRVVREERFQHGDGRCVFRVAPSERLRPGEKHFSLESKLDARSGR